MHLQPIGTYFLDTPNKYVYITIMPHVFAWKAKGSIHVKLLNSFTVWFLEQNTHNSRLLHFLHLN
jgi:hypothetical protein